MLKKRSVIFLGSIFFFSITVHAAPPMSSFAQQLQEADKLAHQGEWDRSERAFLKVLKSAVPEERLKAYQGLTGLYKTLRLNKKARKAELKKNEEKLFLKRLVPSEKRYYKSYEIKKGDSYAKIAAKENISLEWLKRRNDSKVLMAGKTIQVPLLPDRLRVDKSKMILEWKRGDEVLKVYPVTVGKKETQTPSGEFTIISKVKHPIWYRLKVKIPPDSPENLLGTRWLGLDQKGYGIHGTRHPGNLGRAVSHGCVRMRNQDVEELFDWISLGTKVEIGET